MEKSEQSGDQFEKEWVKPELVALNTALDDIQNAAAMATDGIEAPDS